MKLSNHSVPDRLWAFSKPCWGERLASNWHQLPRGPWFSYLAGWVPEWCEALTGQGLVYIYRERESIIYIYYIYLPTYRSMCLPVHICIYIYTYIHTYLSVYLYIHLSIHLSVHLSIRTHTHIQSYTHTHTIYIHRFFWRHCTRVCIFTAPGHAEFMDKSCWTMAGCRSSRELLDLGLEFSPNPMGKQGWMRGQFVWKSVAELPRLGSAWVSMEECGTSMSMMYGCYHLLYIYIFVLHALWTTEVWEVSNISQNFQRGDL